MDLQARERNFIQEFLRIQDERTIARLEDFKKTPTHLSA